MQETSTKPDFSTNLMVFYVLAVVTAGEFYLGYVAKTNVAIYLFSFGLIKAILIVDQYMGIRRLGHSGQAGH